MSSTWLSIILLFPALAMAWEPPLGIPEPPFGIDETHMMYEGQGGYSDAGNGPYTHYIDNTAGNCSDAGNGTQAVPRCTIPTTWAAGSVAEIHGGPYLHPTTQVWTMNGTASQPIFIRGVDDGSGNPVFTADKPVFEGSYAIIENLDGNQSRIDTNNISFMSFRNNEIYNHPSSTGVTISGDNVVVYNNEIHHHQADNRLGLTVTEGSTNIWIVDNTLHHNGDDAIQFCHNCQADPPEFIYVGRNVMFSDRENAIDIKYGNNIVLSQNIAHSYVPSQAGVEFCFDDGSHCATYSSGSDGSGYLLGADGGPTNIWVLYNVSFNNAVGLRNEETFGAYLIGNKIYNISGAAITMDKDGIPLHIIRNTIYNAGIGINQAQQIDFQLFIHNNVFSLISGNHIYIDDSEVSDVSVMSNNLFFDNGNPIDIKWGNSTFSYASTAEFASFPGGTANLVADPLFNDPAQADFETHVASPVIDSGSEVLAALETTFQATFGGTVSILTDFDGLPILDGDASGAPETDMGAHEYPLPDASTTGITDKHCPNWAAIKTNTSGRSVTMSGAVIQNEEITGGGGLRIEAADVTVKCVKINGQFSDLYGINCFTSTGCPGLLVQDVEIFNCDSSCANSQGSAGNHAVWQRVYLHDSINDTMKIRGHTLLEDSYLHSFTPDPEAHNDAIQTSSGSNIIVRNNRIEGPFQAQTSAYIVKSDFSAIDRVLIEGNRMSGGSFTLFLREGNSFPAPTNAVVRDNLFVAGSSQFGQASVDTNAGTCFEWHDNRFGDASLVPAPSSTSLQGTCALPSFGSGCF